MIEKAVEMALEQRDAKRQRLDGSKGVGSMNMPINSVDEVKAWDEHVRGKVSHSSHVLIFKCMK